MYLFPLFSTPIINCIKKLLPYIKEGEKLTPIFIYLFFSQSKKYREKSFYVDSPILFWLATNAPFDHEYV